VGFDIDNASRKVDLKDLILVKSSTNILKIAA